jgi:uncharacterized protein YbjT (DUF2867 family)
MHQRGRSTDQKGRFRDIAAAISKASLRGRWLTLPRDPAGRAACAGEPRDPSRRALPGDVRRHLVEILLQVLDLRTTLLDGDPHEIADRQHGQETVATDDG